MRIKIKNSNGTRELVVKVQYDFTDVKNAYGTDEYGRDVHYAWTEKVTTVKCHEYDPDDIPASKTCLRSRNVPASKTVFIGNAVCDYRDSKRFSKAKGRDIAWKNCIAEMLVKGFVTEEEAIALYIVGTSGTNAEIDMTGDEINIARKITENPKFVQLRFNS